MGRMRAKETAAVASCKYRFHILVQRALLQELDTTQWSNAEGCILFSDRQGPRPLPPRAVGHARPQHSRSHLTQARLVDLQLQHDKPAQLASTLLVPVRVGTSDS